MGLDIQNGALGAEHEQNKNVSVFSQNSMDSTYIETGLRISLRCQFRETLHADRVRDTDASKTKPTYKNCVYLSDLFF